MIDTGPTWDPFQPPPPRPAAPAAQPRQDQRAELQSLAQQTFRTPAGAAFLRLLRAELDAQPSYLPGATFDQVAYAEGQKALLRRIDALLTDERS